MAPAGRSSAGREVHFSSLAALMSASSSYTRQRGSTFAPGCGARPGCSVTADLRPRCDCSASAPGMSSFSMKYPIRHDLSDIITDQIHVSVPRNRRRKAVPGLTLHVTQLPILPNERQEILGMPVTSPERTILDVLREGGPNEQIELAISQALRRGLTTRRRLALTAEAFPKTSQHHLAAMLEKTSP